MREKVEIFIVLAFVIAYLLLVMRGMAQVEGFVVLATYAVKKFLDLNEKDKEQK